MRKPKPLHILLCAIVVTLTAGAVAVVAVVLRPDAEGEMMGTLFNTMISVFHLGATAIIGLLSGIGLSNWDGRK